MDGAHRALSWKQFMESGFDGRAYRFPEKDGVKTGTIVCKRWDRKNNMLVYLDMSDGQKIVTSAWADKNYLGLADMPIGTKIRAVFVRSSQGNAYLKSADRI